MFLASHVRKNGSELQFRPLTAAQRARPVCCSLFSIPAVALVGSTCCAVDVT
jgi:hypothetical protein